mmetsp:Transcript_4298/g.19177  ORF Transcript_4298/g.19177 Transcript_4298/m.19177 type:complete len:313 (-) Transcript_4298:841-1779(-)
MRSLHDAWVSASDLSAVMDQAAADRRARSSSRHPSSSLALASLSLPPPPRADDAPDAGPVHPRADCDECCGDTFESVESKPPAPFSPKELRRGTGISLESAPPADADVGLGRGTIVVTPPSRSSACSSEGVSTTIGFWPHASDTHLTKPRAREGCESSASARTESAFSAIAASRFATLSLAAPRQQPNSAAHADIPLSLARSEPSTTLAGSAASASRASAAGAMAVCVGPSPEQLSATTRSTTGPDSILHGPDRGFTSFVNPDRVTPSFPFPPFAPVRPSWRAVKSPWTTPEMSSAATHHASAPGFLDDLAG